jgi:hypothetical protein
MVEEISHSKLHTNTNTILGDYMLTEYRRNTYHKMLQVLAPYPFILRYNAVSTAFKADSEVPDVTHIFHEGMYTRQVTLAPDMLILGKVHKLPCLFMVLQGTIFIDSAEFVGEVSAPFILTSGANVARWGYSLTECVVANVFVTTATSAEEFELLYSEDLL